MITITWSEVSSTTAYAGGDIISALPGVLELDILEAETYEMSSLVTEHTIEDSAAITDHNIPHLDRVRFDAMISDSPLSIDQGLLGTAYQTQKNGTIVLISPDTSRTSLAFDTLHRLSREGIEVDIIGLSKEVKGWVITSVTCERRVETAGALVFSIAAQEVVTATLTEIAAPSPRVERARVSTDAGQQVTQVAGDSTVSPNPNDRDTGTQSLMDDYYTTQLDELGI